MASSYPTRKNPRLPEYDYSQPGYYFVTVCTAVRHKDVLCSVTNVGGGLRAAPRVTLAAIGQTVAGSIAKIPILNPGAEVDCSVIMPDHIHLLIYMTGRHGGRPLPDIIGRLKSYTDHNYRSQFPSFSSKLWQRGYYEHMIRNDADLTQTRRYIQNNPLNWTLKQGGWAAEGGGPYDTNGKEENPRGGGEKSE